jgi:hypothetical protein
MSNAGKSYEAWKESFIQADAAGDDDWSEQWSGAGPQLSHGLGPMELKGVATGLLLGVGLLIVGAFALLLNIKHLTHGERTVGIVVEHKDYHNRPSNTLRAPVVRYSAPGGVYDVVGSLSVPRRIYPVDKEVSVLYLPSNPSDAVIFDFMQLFLIPSVVGGIGLVCLAGTTGFMFMNARSELLSACPAQWPSRQISSLLAEESPAGSAAGQAGSATSGVPTVVATKGEVPESYGNAVSSTSGGEAAASR